MTRRGPALVVILLLAATAVAFATTERQKLEKTPFAVLPIEGDISPVCRCPTAGTTISLRFRRTHVLTVQILDADGRVVRSLVEERTVRKGIINVRWDGRNAVGKVLPDGEYSPRFVLDNGRTFDPPNPIRIDTIPPRMRLVSYSPRILKRHSKLRVRYRVSETAHPIMYVNGRQEVFGNAKALLGNFEWFVRRNGRRLRPGRYRLQLAAVDLAGNVGPKTSPFVVRVR